MQLPKSPLPKELLSRSLTGSRVADFQRTFGQSLLPLRQVHGFVAEDELVFALLAEGRMLVNYTLRDLEAKLDPEKFARVHKGTIVNLASVAEIEPLGSGGAMARLQSGATIEISRRYRTALQSRLGW